MWSRRNRAVCFLLLLVSLTSLASEKRDLSKYDTIPKIHLPAGALSDVQIEEQARLREFLWSHFAENRLGCVSVEARSLEGDLTETTYLIEPDQQGIWHINVDQSRVSVDRQKRGTKKKSSAQLEAYALERTLTAASGSQARIPKEQQVDPKTYRLELKDKNGKVLLEI